MSRFTTLTLAIAVSFGAMFALPATIEAQEVVHHVYRNTASVRDLIKAVGRDSKEFRAKFEKRYNGMFIANWRRSDESRKAMQRMDEALEHVNARQANGEKQRYLRDDVKKVVERARILDRMFRRPDDVLASMRSDWGDLKGSIDDLAAAYELPDIDDE